MKVKKALLLAISIVSLVSCYQWDDSLHGLPDYSFYKTGIYDVRVDTSSFQETNFEYTSWIEVPTKPYREEIQLAASLENTEGEINILGKFNFDNNNSYIIRKGIGNKRYQDITIVDSVLIYRVIFGEVIIDYEMPYQTALYNDGKTSGQMARCCFEDIVDNGYELTTLSTEEMNGIIFMRKLFRHSITVQFNGKPYQATATIVLKKQIGLEGDEYLISSRLLEQGISNIKNDVSYTSYQSWIKVERTYSTGKKENTKYEFPLYAELKISPITDFKFTAPDLQIISAGFAQDKEHILWLPKTQYVDAYYYEKYYVVSYNYGSTEIVFYDVDVVYDDGYNVFNFPTLHYNDIKDEYVLELTHSGEDGFGKYEEYKFTQQISATVGNTKHQDEKTYSFVIADR